MAISRLQARWKIVSHFELLSDVNVNYRMAIRIFSIMAYSHFGIKSGYKPAISRL